MRSLQLVTMPTTLVCKYSTYRAAQCPAQQAGGGRARTYAKFTEIEPTLAHAISATVTKTKASTFSPLELIDTKVPAFIYFSSVGSPVFQNLFFKISPFALADRDGHFLAIADRGGEDRRVR